MYKPQPPHLTLDELKSHDNLAFQVVLTIVRHAAKQLYHASPATHDFGLEKCEEIILHMLEEGTAKIIQIEDEFDEAEDQLWIGYFNSATGEYQLPQLGE